MIAGLLNEVTLPSSLDRLDHALVDDLSHIDIWLYDYGMVNLRSLRTGAEGLVRGWRAGLSVPLSCHGEMLGFVTAELAEGSSGAASQEALEQLAPLLAAAVTTSGRVDDAVCIARRQRAMGLAAELQWSLLPPTRFESPRCVVSAAVEPAYETGGDVFDYALRDGHLLLAVLDAMGHGLESALVSSVAVAGFRRARRAGDALHEMAAQIDEAVRSLGRPHFVSAVLADVDLASGRGAYLSAGHVPPLVVAGGEVRELGLSPTLPLGLRIGAVASRPVVRPFVLAPGDALVLYSDGIIDNDNQLSDDSQPAGFERLVGLLGARLSPGDTDTDTDTVGPERPLHPARDVVDSLLTMTGPDLRDDATLLMAQCL